MLRSISDAVQNVMSLEEPGIYGMAQSLTNIASRVLCLRSASFPSLVQCLLFMTVALGALSDTLISITSGPSECADLSKRACPLAS